MRLTEIEIAQVTTRVLSGEAWSSVAAYFGMGHQKLRRVTAERLRLHVPKKRVVKKKRKYRRKKTSKKSAS